MWTLLRVLPVVLLSLCCARTEPHELQAPAPEVAEAPAGVAGSLAWAPDSQRFVLIDEGRLLLVDLFDHRRAIFSDRKPLFVDWAPEDRLLLVDASGPVPRLLELDPDAQETASAEIATRRAPLAARWLADGGGLLLLSGSVKSTRFGVLVDLDVSLLEKGAEEVLHRLDTILPVTPFDPARFRDLFHAGPRPILDSLYLPEYHNPPAAPPYLRLLMVGPRAADLRSMLDLPTRHFTLPGSWSPDGSRLALTDEQGGLVLFEPGADRLEPTGPPAVRGRYPSWNPRGETIFLGGAIISAGGRLERELMADGEESVGYWSPDGRHLAVRSRQGLLLFHELDIELGAGDAARAMTRQGVRDRLRRLRKLRAEDLIDEPEYLERSRALLDSVGLIP